MNSSSNSSARMPKKSSGRMRCVRRSSGLARGSHRYRSPGVVSSNGARSCASSARTTSTELSFSTIGSRSSVIDESCNAPCDKTTFSTVAAACDRRCVKDEARQPQVRCTPAKGLQEHRAGRDELRGGCHELRDGDDKPCAGGDQLGENQDEPGTDYRERGKDSDEPRAGSDKPRQGQCQPCKGSDILCVALRTNSLTDWIQAIFRLPIFLKTMTRFPRAASSFRTAGTSRVKAATNLAPAGASTRKTATADARTVTNAPVEITAIAETASSASAMALKSFPF